MFFSFFTFLMFFFSQMFFFIFFYSSSPYWLYLFLFSQLFLSVLSSIFCIFSLTTFGVDVRYFSLEEIIPPLPVFLFPSSTIVSCLFFFVLFLLYLLLYVYCHLLTLAVCKVLPPPKAVTA